MVIRSQKLGQRQDQSEEAGEENAGSGPTMVSRGGLLVVVRSAEILQEHLKHDIIKES